jgi:hypothetical protein
VLSHDLSFLATYGADYELALRATGHGEQWTLTVAVVLAISMALLSAASVRMAILWRRTRALEREAGTRGDRDWSSLGRRVLWIWVVLGGATVLAFVAQENVERIVAGGVAPGIEPLLPPGGIGPLPIIAAVSLLAAAVGCLFTEAPRALRARIAAALARLQAGRPAATPRPPVADVHRPCSLLARNLGRRAPPALALA